MDDSALTSQAIAELMREMPGQSGLAYFRPQERKINPLGKPNKRFLGRTINNVLRHNKRETERTQASCMQKLQELDDSYERRKRNEFYREDYDERRPRKSRSKKKSKHYRSRSSSRNSVRESRSRSRRHKKKSKKKKEKKVKKKRRERNSYERSSSEREERVKGEAITAPSTEYLVHSNNLALAVAMAYSQAMSAQKTLNNVPNPPASPLSDIINELMSDEELESKPPSDALSIASSSDEVQEILTIDVSSQEEQSSDSSDSETDSESSSAAVSCIALEDSEDDDELAPNSGSDIEIIESEPRDRNIELPQETVELEEKQQPAADLATTVDLTED